MADGGERPVYPTLKPGESITVTVRSVTVGGGGHRVVLEGMLPDAGSSMAGQSHPEEPGRQERYRARAAEYTEKGRQMRAILDAAQGAPPLKTAIVFPVDEPSLTGAVEAAKAEFISPVLIGPKAKLQEVAAAHDLDISPYRIIAAEDGAEAAAIAVNLARDGKVDALMKGSLHTDVLMHAIISEPSLRTERRMSHVFVVDAPEYPRMLLITDAAINIYPTLEEKIDILKNAIDLAHTLGIALPKVAILSAVETVESKIHSTIDAAALCKMADRGQITGAILDGPLAFDNAVSMEAAKTKGIISPVAGQADIFLVPDLEAGNMLAKQLEYLADADISGIVLGARVPVILTSRADKTLARLGSCVLALLVARAAKTART